MSPEELTRRVKDEARRLGFELVGVARADRVADEARLAEWLERGLHGTMGWMENHVEKRVDPRALVPGCRSLVCVGLVYDHPADEAPQPVGIDVATYAWGEDYHRVLKDRLHELLDFGRDLDAAFDGRVFVDSAPVMDKYWAERAGLGWRGKNTNLLNARLGSFFFLGELLVRAELVPDEPGTDHCGTCTACIDACPTGALDEPYVLDATKCISYWTIEHRGDLEASQEASTGTWLFGCDVCQDVCPWNRKSPEAVEPRFEPRRDAWPASLDDVLTMSESEFEKRFADTAIERARRRGLVRNAAIVAGNTGRGTIDALRAAAGDDDPVVAGAARRALERRRAARPGIFRGMGDPRPAGSELHVRRIPVGPFLSNAWIAWGEAPGPAVLIDAGDEADRLLAELESLGLELAVILQTHAHADHIAALPALVEATGAAVYLHPDAEPMLHSAEANLSALAGMPVTAPVAYRPVAGGDEIEVLGRTVRVAHVPGHAPGSVCYHFVDDGVVFTGDTLFHGSIGRTDFPGGSAETLLRGIRDSLLSLPDETRVLAGHMEETTIGQERRSNPFLRLARDPSGRE